MIGAIGRILAVLFFASLLLLSLLMFATSVYKDPSHAFSVLVWLVNVGLFATSLHLLLTDIRS